MPSRSETLGKIALVTAASGALVCGIIGLVDRATNPAYQKNNLADQGVSTLIPTGIPTLTSEFVFPEATDFPPLGPTATPGKDCDIADYFHMREQGYATLPQRVFDKKTGKEDISAWSPEKVISYWMGTSQSAEVWTNLGSTGEMLKNAGLINPYQVLPMNTFEETTFNQYRKTKLGFLNVVEMKNVPKVILEKGGIVDKIVENYNWTREDAIKFVYQQVAIIKQNVTVDTQGNYGEASQVFAMMGSQNGNGDKTSYEALYEKRTGDINVSQVIDGETIKGRVSNFNRQALILIVKVNDKGEVDKNVEPIVVRFDADDFKGPGCLGGSGNYPTPVAEVTPTPTIPGETPLPPPENTPGHEVTPTPAPPTSHPLSNPTATPVMENTPRPPNPTWVPNPTYPGPTPNPTEIIATPVKTPAP